MSRLWPRSLLGQVLLAVALALLAAQSISAVLLYRAAAERRETAMLHVAAFRLGMDPRAEMAGPMPRAGRPAHRAALASGPAMPRTLRLERTTVSPLRAGEVGDSETGAALEDILAGERGIGGKVVVIRRLAGDDPFVRARANRLQRDPQWAARSMLVAGLLPQGAQEWRVARVLAPRGEPRALWNLALQTLVLYLVLVGILAVLLRRITRPIAALTGRLETFARRPGPADPLVAEGPDDVRRLITAHNAMEARIAALLDEKDVMLGAIGHDLKTPLAALRVRIEGVEDEAERARMAATIEDIVRTLDDILSLARVGRASEPPERTELAALAASVVEEFEDMGDPVTLAEGPRVVAPVHVTWAKRALRNLVANAVRYGGEAEVSAFRDGADAVLRVTDRGPGIRADLLATITEPFVRGEASRNRGTGGAGLGLTLARAIAEAHGGRLVLTNRTPDGADGGLAAELRLPL
jgi:signal transduction histidine kinase